MNQFRFSIEQVNHQRSATWRPDQCEEEPLQQLVDPWTDFKNVPSTTKKDKSFQQSFDDIKNDVEINLNTTQTQNVSTPSLDVVSVHKATEEYAKLWKHSESTSSLPDVSVNIPSSDSFVLHPDPGLTVLTQTLPSNESPHRIPSVHHSPTKKMESPGPDQISGKELHKYSPEEITTYREKKSYMSVDLPGINQSPKKKYRKKPELISPGHGLECVSNYSGSDSLSERLSDVSGIGDDLSKIKGLLNCSTESHLDSYNVMEGQVSLLTKQLNEALVDNQKLRSDYDSLVMKMQNEDDSKYLDALRAKAHFQGQLESTKKEVEEFIGERSRLLKMISSLQADVRLREDKLMDYEEKTQKMSTEMRQQQKKKNLAEQNLVKLQLEKSNVQHTGSVMDSHAMRVNEQLTMLKASLESKDASLSDLKQKHAETVTELHKTIAGKIQGEAELRSLRSEVSAIHQSRDWYKQQLHQAQAVKNNARQELLKYQQSAVAQASIVEKVKGEMKLTKQQLKDTKERAVREKEALMRHLREIEADLLERESFFEQAQKEKGVNEVSLIKRLKKLEDEKHEAHSLKYHISDLTQQLEHANKTLADRDQRLTKVGTENKQLTSEVAALKQQVSSHELNMQQLKSDSTLVSQTIEELKREKELKCKELEESKQSCASLQTALDAATEERKQVDEAVQQLKAELSKVANKIQSLNDELAEKQREVTAAHQEIKASETRRESCEQGATERAKESSQEKLQLEREVTKLKEELADQNQTIVQYQDDVTRLISNSNEKTQEISVLNHRLHALTSEIKKYEDLLKKSESPKEEPQTRTSDVDSQISQENRQLKEKLQAYEMNIIPESERQLRSLKLNLNQLQEQLQFVTGERNRVKTDMAALVQRYNLDFEKFKTTGSKQEIQNSFCEKKVRATSQNQLTLGASEDGDSASHRVSSIEKDIRPKHMLDLEKEKNDVSEWRSANSHLNLLMSKENVYNDNLPESLVGEKAGEYLDLRLQICELLSKNREQQQELQSKTKENESLLAKMNSVRQGLVEQNALKNKIKEYEENLEKVNCILEQEMRTKEALTAEKEELQARVNTLQSDLDRMTERGGQRREQESEDTQLTLRSLHQELKESRNEKENLQNTQNVLEERAKSMEEYALMLSQKVHGLELERNKLSEELSQWKSRHSVEPDVIQNTAVADACIRCSTEVQTEEHGERTLVEEYEGQIEALNSKYSELQNKYKRCESNIKLLVRKLKEEMRARRMAERHKEESDENVASVNTDVLSDELRIAREEIGELQGRLRERPKMEEDNVLLQLEIEKLKGKFEGISGTYSVLQQHTNEIEEELVHLRALKKQLETQMDEKVNAQDKLKVSTLEAALETERKNEKELKRQLSVVRKENAGMRNQITSLKTGWETANHQLDAKKKEMQQIQNEMEKWRVICDGKQSEVESKLMEIAELRGHMETYRLEIADYKDKEPHLQHNINTLEFELAQKSQEAKGLSDRLELTEQNHRREVRGLGQSLQKARKELSTLQAELDTAVRLRCDYQQKVTQLRSALKIVMQHKESLEAHLSAYQDAFLSEGSSPDSRPPSPVPLDEEMIQDLLERSGPRKTVAPTEENSQALSRLHACLQSLNEDVEGLNKQLESSRSGYSSPMSEAFSFRSGGVSPCEDLSSSSLHMA